MSSFDWEQPSLSLMGHNFARCQLLSRVESASALYASIDGILEELVHNFQLDAAALVIRKPHQLAFASYLHDIHSFGISKDEKKKLSFFLAQTVVPDVQQRAQCVRREDVRHDLLGNLAEGQRTKLVSMLSVPMFHEGEVIGIFLAFRTEIAAFCADDERFFQRVASILAEDLESTHAYLRVARDPLTGFYSRRVFFEALSQETARARRYQAPLSIMMLEIDHLLPANSPSKTDQLLKRFSQRLVTETRQSDIISRASDSAFVFLLPMTSAKSSAEVAHRIRDHLNSNPMILNEVAIALAISVGVSSFRSLDDDGTAMLMRADQAVNAARKKGINHIVIDAGDAD